MSLSSSFTLNIVAVSLFVFLIMFAIASSPFACFSFHLSRRCADVWSQNPCPCAALIMEFFPIHLPAAPKNALTADYPINIYASMRLWHKAL
jgi:hypothetical protein